MAKTMLQLRMPVASPVGSSPGTTKSIGIPGLDFFRLPWFTTAAPAAIEQRRAVLDVAYAAHPERFVRKPPQPLPAPTEVWINKPLQTPENKTQ